MSVFIMIQNKLNPLSPLSALPTVSIVLRNKKAILDYDLAELYGIPTKALNQAVSRNIDRFPEDFIEP